jgi:hypothetical protein
VPSPDGGPARHTTLASCTDDHSQRRLRCVSGAGLRERRGQDRRPGHCKAAHQDRGGQDTDWHVSSLKWVPATVRASTQPAATSPAEAGRRSGVLAAMGRGAPVTRVPTVIPPAPRRPHYMGPEIWKNRPYSYTSDTWAIGCLLYELMALAVSAGLCARGWVQCACATAGLPTPLGRSQVHVSGLSQCERPLSEAESEAESGRREVPLMHECACVCVHVCVHVCACVHSCTSVQHQGQRLAPPCCSAVVRCLPASQHVPRPRRFPSKRAP